MRIEDETIIYPLPTEEYLLKKRKSMENKITRHI